MANRNCVTPPIGAAANSAGRTDVTQAITSTRSTTSALVPSQKVDDVDVRFRRDEFTLEGDKLPFRNDASHVSNVERLEFEEALRWLVEKYEETVGSVFGIELQSADDMLALKSNARERLSRIEVVPCDTSALLTNQSFSIADKWLRLIRKIEERYPSSVVPALPQPIKTLSVAEKTELPFPNNTPESLHPMSAIKTTPASPKWSTSALEQKYLTTLAELERKCSDVNDGMKILRSQANGIVAEMNKLKFLVKWDLGYDVHALRAKLHARKQASAGPSHSAEAEPKNFGFEAHAPHVKSVSGKQASVGPSHNAEAAPKTPDFQVKHDCGFEAQASCAKSVTEKQSLVGPSHSADTAPKYFGFEAPALHVKSVAGKQASAGPSHSADVAPENLDFQADRDLGFEVQAWRAESVAWKQASAGPSHSANSAPKNLDFQAERDLGFKVYASRAKSIAWKQPSAQFSNFRNLAPFPKVGGSRSRAQPNKRSYNSICLNCNKGYHHSSSCPILKTPVFCRLCKTSHLDFLPCRPFNVEEEPRYTGKVFCHHCKTTHFDFERCPLPTRLH